MKLSSAPFIHGYPEIDILIIAIEAQPAEIILEMTQKISCKVLTLRTVEDRVS